MVLTGAGTRGARLIHRPGLWGLGSDTGAGTRLDPQAQGPQGQVTDTGAGTMDPSPLTGL